jgi:phage gpG-like protein
MPGPFNIEIEGMRELLASFKTVEEGMIDFRQLGTWKAVQSEFYKIEKDIFGSEGASGKTGKWKALSPAYAKVKQKRYGPLPILQATGAMYKQFTSDAGNVTQTAQEMTFRFSQPAGYHMSKAARKKMPYRSSMEFTEAQEKQLMKPVQEKLKQLIANAKLRDIRGF